MRGPSPRLLLPLLLALSACALAGCPQERGDHSGEAPKPAKKKVLVFGTNSEPDVLNPLFAEMAAAR